MNVAVVDIGSNSTRLLIAEIEDHRVRRELVRHSEVTRLGAGVDADGRLRDDAMQRVYTTLDGYKAEIDEHDGVGALCVGPGRGDRARRGWCCAPEPSPHRKSDAASVRGSCARPSRVFPV